MRIVGGSLRGRRFEGPVDDRTRPTSDRAREGIASALLARDLIAHRSVLDLYAGTGALAFEALSRGAANAVLVERDRNVLRALRRSVATLDLAERTELLSLDLNRETSPEEICRLGPFGLVFADPPYAGTERFAPLLGQLMALGALSNEAAVVLEHSQSTPFEVPEHLPLSLEASYRYGEAAFELLRVS